MDIPTPVRQRLLYLNTEAGGRRGVALPISRLQSFDAIISQSVFGSTLADTLEIQTPFAGSKYAFFTLYRISSARIVLPRLQFTFAVAAQSLALLLFMLALTIRNGPVRSYHFVAQIVRLPIFFFISFQLMYVMYYQIFSIAYLATSPTLKYIFVKKVVYAAGVSFILMHQVDVRVAVSLWRQVANTDSYYAARLAWVLGSLSLLVWSLTQTNPDHFIVASKPDCPLLAMECNTTVWFFTQHWVCIGIIIGHPITFVFIHIIRWRRNRSEHRSWDRRHPDYVTSFEAYGCGAPLSEYYHTLVTREVDRKDGNTRTVQYLTCAKAVRDEGFVMLGGCNALVRAKDVYVFLLMKLIPRRYAAHVNLSVVIAHVVDFRLTPLRRISYEALWSVSRRWDVGLSYPDIG